MNMKSEGSAAGLFSIFHLLCQELEEEEDEEADAGLIDSTSVAGKYRRGFRSLHGRVLLLHIYS